MKTEPFTMHTFKLYLEGGAIVTVEARNRQAATDCAGKDWRRDIGGTMPDVIFVQIASSCRVAAGDPTPRVLEAKVPA